jgi:hypothetical protein
LGELLFGRDALLNAGGVKIASRSPSGGQQSTLRFTFRVERSSQKEPNTAAISIYNLSKATRARLQELALPTILEAGYFGSRSTIFAGKLEYGSTTRDGANWITALQSSDGGQQIASSRVNLSFAGGTDIGTVLRRLAQELGLGLGNVREKAAAGSLRGAITQYLNGIVLNGKTYEQLEKVARQMGYGLSVQAGQIQLLGPTETLAEEAVLLTRTTGLIGSPEAGEDGKVKARSLLQPDLVPGRRLRIESEEVTGFYRVERSIFTGDTWGQDWYTDVEGKPL